MTSTKYMSLFTTVTIFTALFAILYQGYLASKDLQRLTTILTSLMFLENKIIVNTIPRIAIGYGSCNDVYVHATKFFNYTDLINNKQHEAVNNDNKVITDQQELLNSFAYYFRRGAAAERYTSNKELFKSLIEKAQLSGIIKWELGGNAPVMGARFSKEGADVLLAAQMTPGLQETLPKEIRLAGKNADYDDVHLILEYKAGEEWGDIVAPRANRYILHNDQNNPTINSLESFDELLPEFNPKLFVVSGLQMLDNYPFLNDLREKRIQKVQEQIAKQSKSTLIHFEMASYVELELLELLLKYVIPYSDSLGMNEQEIDNLQSVIVDGKISFSADSNPRVAKTLTQMRTIFRVINSNYLNNMGKDNKRRMLTRLHVHTLAYQAILIVNESQWNNTKNAAAKSSLTAHRHVCGTDIVNPEMSYLVLDDSFATSTITEKNIPKRIVLNDMEPVSCWSEIIDIEQDNNDIKHFNIEICLAPVLVCRVAKQTAGAGDNISASGLVMQVY